MEQTRRPNSPARGPAGEMTEQAMAYYLITAQQIANCCELLRGDLPPLTRAHIHARLRSFVHHLFWLCGLEGR